MNASPKSHFLDASVVHYEWNNAIAPRLTIDPGDTVVFETRDASDEFYSPDSTHEDVMRRVFKGHPLTGPVRIRGAQPGDVLAVEIVEVAPRASFGWTNVRPGAACCRKASSAVLFCRYGTCRTVALHAACKPCAISRCRWSLFRE